MTVVRPSADKCKAIRNILQTHMVRYEERDMFMSAENQKELKERLGQSAICVPQVFADGVHIGVSYFGIFFFSSKYQLVQWVHWCKITTGWRVYEKTPSVMAVTKDNLLATPYHATMYFNNGPFSFPNSNLYCQDWHYLEYAGRDCYSSSHTQSWLHVFFRIHLIHFLLQFWFLKL